MRLLAGLSIPFCLMIGIAAAQKTDADVLPHIEGETLSGKPITLPDAAHGHFALLTIGFSHKSGEATRAWGIRFHQDFGADSRYVVYLVAELEDAPRFIRGMILSGMRKGTPVPERDHFVTLFHGEADLKKFVGFSGPDDAYLLLLDAKGTVRWLGHGLFRDGDYAALQAAAKALAN